MKTKKYEIYECWKDKAITKEFLIKRWEDCSAEDEAVKITGYPDEIFCWACQMIPYNTSLSPKIEVYWNQDHFLDRAHILAKSKGGLETADNLFLLCPDCHAESPDTTNPQNFFAWVYYKRTNESFVQVFERELAKTAKIKGIPLEELLERCGELNLDSSKLAELRKRVGEKCALHGMTISMSSKMFSFIEALQEITQKPKK